MTVKKHKLNIFLEVHTLLKETARFVSKGTECNRGVCRGPAHREIHLGSCEENQVEKWAQGRVRNLA